MEVLLYFIVAIVIFGVLAWGAFWLCDKAGAPQPVKWVVGAIFLLILLFAAVRMFSGRGGSVSTPRIEINE